MRTSRFVLIVAALVATSSTSNAELCADRGGKLSVREECRPSETATEALTVCASTNDRLAVRSSCPPPTRVAFEADGPMCAAKGGRLIQRSICRKKEREVASAKVCVSKSGSVSYRTECRGKSVAIREVGLVGLDEFILSVQPTGGGEGYGDWVDHQGELVRYLTGSGGLLDRLASATPGDVILVADEARIDLTAQKQIVIPRGVTLAGGRGRNGALGGLLFSDDRSDDGREPVFYMERNSRLTGLRLQGPSLAYDWKGCQGDASLLITIEGDNDGANLGIRVDNNEIYGWSQGVKAFGASGVTVDHNHIHHNQRMETGSSQGCRNWSLGYGVVVYTGKQPQKRERRAAHVLIEANLFHHNRHDIASDGGTGSAYTARYNLVHDARLSHSFDVHEERRPDDVYTGTAGDWVEIHHNIFFHDDYPAVQIRAIPERGAFIHHNQFAHARAEAKPNEPGAIHQRMKSKGLAFIYPFRDIEAYYNEVGFGPVTAWFMAPGGASAPLRRGDELDGLTMGGEGSSDDREPGFWTLRRIGATPITEVAFGDFDCDGRQDAFRTTGSSWQYSPDARGDWVKLNSSGISLAHLRLGDFDGDGCTDVFRSSASAHRWYVSWGGRSRWVALNSSGIAVENLAFGDFDGDGRTDVFRSSSSTHRWYVSWGGSSRWAILNSSGVAVENLAFGDFDGDGRTDIFYANGSDWQVSWSGASRWRHLNSSRARIPELGFGDFDGNGTTDVLRRNTSSGKWEISWSGESLWEKTRGSSLGPASLGFADVNGDGATDILSMQVVD